MVAESFYLQCPSNASMHIFPNNTLSAFTVHLDTPLDLGDAYEVGLCEMQYPQSWDNVRRGNNVISITYQYHSRGKDAITMEKEIPTGYYNSIPKLIDVIKSVYGTTKRSNVTLHGLEMEYNPATRRVSVSADKMQVRIKRKNGKVHTPSTNYVVIKLNDDIARLLGFKNGTLIESGKLAQSEFPATVSGGFHQMYVYSDMIKPQPHPDGNVAILRTIAVEGKPNQDYLSRRFQKVYYMPLTKNTISTISFKILDDTGKLIGFDFGKVLIVLHFRRKGIREMV